MNRRTFTVAAATLMAAPRAWAQAAGRTFRVGRLSSGSRSQPSPLQDAFERGMRELGYVEGHNLVLDSRYAEGKLDELPSLARELIAPGPDALFVVTTPAALAAKRATSTIPIVFVAVADPLGTGIVADLARPEGNVTGITHIGAELTGKRLELLKEMIPAAQRVAVLVNPDDPNAAVQLRHAEQSARMLKVSLAPILFVRGANDLEQAFDAASRAGASAALRMVDPTIIPLRARTTELALKHRIPVIYAFGEDAEAGGLAAYGPSLPAQFHQAAALVHRILRGAKPGDLPVEQPTRFELVLNLRTAEALGVAIPRSILLRADRVIE